MSSGSEFNFGEFGEVEFNQLTSEQFPVEGLRFIVQRSNGEVLNTERLITSGYELSFEFTEDGYSTVFHLLYFTGEDLPGENEKFVITFPHGFQAVVITKTVPKVASEFYGSDPEQGIFILRISATDLLTFYYNEGLPSSQMCPFVNTTTGAIWRSILPLYDGLFDVSGIEDGNSVDSLNLSELSSLGDLLRSEIMHGGYKLRMGSGYSVQGDFEGNFVAGSDYAVQFNDYRYTPPRQEVDPPDQLLGSVTVVPNRKVPVAVHHYFCELDLRAQSQANLPTLPLGLDDSEPLNLSSQIDLSDTDQFDTSGVTSNGAQLELNGYVQLREARPFKFPFMTVWKGLTFGPGASYQFGFTDDCGASPGFIWSVSSSDYPVEEDTLLVQNRYAIYAVSKNSGAIDIWGIHLKQDFSVDGDLIISSIVSIDAPNSAITLSSPWNVQNTYVRVVSGGSEVGRAYIRRISEDGLTLTLDIIPPGTANGNDVSRGVSADSILTQTFIKSVSAGAGYGMPRMEGSGANVEAMSVQRTGQVYGKLLFESNTNPDSDYPRDLVLNVDLTEFSDAEITASGSSATVVFNTKFSHEQQAWFLFSYVFGKQKKFNSAVSLGAHVTVPVELEDDPVILQEMADEIKALGQNVYPRVSANIESSEIEGLPLPHDLLPVALVDEYQIDNQDIPITTVKLEYKGARILSQFQDDSTPHDNEDYLLYSINAGPKEPVDRILDKFLRGVGITKYPLRSATIAGSVISSINWDDETGLFTASISGGTAYGPRGEVLDFGAGIRPADVGNVLNPGAQPVTIRCSIAVAGRTEPDLFALTVVYKPNAINPDTADYTWFHQERRVQFNWEPVLGVTKFNIYKRREGATGEADADLVLVDTVPFPGSSWSGAVTKDDRTIWVESEGLCGKRSAKVKLFAVLDPLPAPTVFQAVRDIKHNGRIVLLLSAPPGGADEGRTTGLKIFIRTSTDGTDYNERDDFPDAILNTDGVDVRILPVVSQTSAARYRFIFDEFDPNADGNEVWVNCCWVDQFEDEGIFKPGFDIAHLPFEVGSVSPSTHFRTPNPLTPLTNQAAGGTYIDDDDTTNKIEDTGKFRVFFGPHTDAVKLFYERSSKTTDNTTGLWNTNEFITESFRHELTDDEMIQGFVDVDMYRKFVHARKKHWTYRLQRVVFFGIEIRELTITGGETSFARPRRILMGFDGNPAGQPIVPYETDAYFDKTQFHFQPWLGSLPNSFFKVLNVRANFKPNQVLMKWDRIDDANLWRYIAFISTTNFGTKGPGTDATIATALDTILKPTAEGGGGGAGSILLYRQDNSVKDVTCYAVEIGTPANYSFLVGEVFGAITVTAGVTYFVGIIAQNKAGRYSDQVSDTDSDPAGNPDGALTPGALAFPSAPSGANNSIDVDPSTSMARILLTLITASGTFTANNISQIEIVLVRLDSSGNPISGSSFTEVKALTTAELVTATCNHEFYRKMGKRYRITAVIAKNGDKRTQTLGTANFVAGGVLNVEVGDSKTVTGAVITAITHTDTDDVYSDDIAFTLTQDGVDIVLYEKLVVQRSINSGPFRGDIIIPLKSLTALHASVSGSYSDVISIPRRPGKTAQYRFIAFANGGKPSANTDSSIQAAVTGSVPNDTGVPSGLTQPILEWTADGKLKIRNMQATTNIEHEITRYIVLYNGSSTYYDFVNNAVAASEAAARFKVGKTGHVPLTSAKKKKLQAVFGSSGTINIFAYWYSENAFGASLKSADSAALNLTAQPDYMGVNDAPLILDVSSRLGGHPDQLLYDGDLLYDDGATGPNKWGAGVSLNSNSAITTSSADPVYWDKPNHSLIYQDAAWSFKQNLKKKFTKSEYVAVSFLAKTDGSFGSGTLTVTLVDVTTASGQASQSYFFQLSALTSSYKLFGGIIRFSSSLAFDNILLVFVASATLSATNNIIFDKFMMCRGRDIYPYSPRSAKEGGASNFPEDINSGTPNNVAVGDIGSGSGSQGGSVVPGGGGIEVAVV